jgi:GNAT superfamily N-acetyltransferase
VLLGLMERGSPSQSRPAAVAASFARQLGDPGQLVVVGALDGRAVGYGTCSTLGVPGEELIGSVSELYVELASRRKGVGRAMAASVLEWCQAAGCNGVDALALPGSRATKSFFEAEGFVARLLVMHRPLPAAGPGQRPSERSQAPR